MDDLKNVTEKKRYRALLPALFLASAVYVAFSVYEGDTIVVLTSGFSKETAVAAVESILPFSFMRWVVFAAFSVCAYFFFVFFLSR